jgi:hypothetical protein
VQGLDAAKMMSESREGASADATTLVVDNSAWFFNSLVGFFTFFSPSLLS